MKPWLRVAYALRRAKTAIIYPCIIAPLAPCRNAGQETATPQSHKRHTAAIDLRYDALWVALVNMITSHLHVVNIN